MNTERTVFDHYELRDLLTGRSWYFEDLYEARAAVTALGLTRWQIISGLDNAVERSADAPACAAPLSSVDVKPDEYAVENLYGYRDQPTVQAYLGTEAELMDYMDRVYGRTIDDPPSSIRIWERFGGNWVPHDKALREIVCGAARRTRRSYVLERDHDYQGLEGRQRWTALCDDGEDKPVAETNGMFTGMEDLIAEFSVYLGARHADAERLRITVEEVE